MLHSRPKYEALVDFLLEMTRERTAQALLDRIVTHLANLSGVALARIWLAAPGDTCNTCPMRAHCPDQKTCLHLVASAEHSQATDSTDGPRLNDRYRRIPLGHREIGHIATDGAPVETTDIKSDPEGMIDPAWLRREDILGFAGHPLALNDPVPGVLAVFTRVRPVPESLTWLRMVARHAAVALKNVYAFEEAGRLKKQLELENITLRRTLSALPVPSAGTSGARVLPDAEIRRLERENTLAALHQAHWKVYGPGGAAEHLGLKPTTLVSRIKKMGLKKTE